ncbi:MAG: tetratricopeptide repeat protein [Acidobacteriaceae bacterium]
MASARDLVTEGKLDDALRELDALAAQRPEPAGVERLRGIVDYQQNRMAAAEGDFTRAVQQDRSDLQSMQMRGIVLFRMNLPGEAIPILEKAHSSAPIANADPNYVLALCYIATGRYDDARHAFAAQYGFPPDSAAAWLFSARMLFRQELTAPATAAAQQALKRDPHLPLAHRLLGEIALAAGDAAGALTELEQEIRVNPLDGETYNRMGDAYLRSGQPDRAQQALDRAVLLEPDASGPFILLGKALLEEHDPVMATMYLKHAEGMDPSNPMTHMLLGRAYAVSGRKDAAQREFQLVQKMQGATGTASSQR